jgi:membrane protease YdiL (CAAX protease family)
MWTPGIASVIARLARREGFGDVSFRWGGRAGTVACGLAWVFPLIVGLTAYGIAWATGLAQFQPARMAARLPAVPVPIGFLFALAFSATVGALVGCLSAAGEELGWRGYMLTRLIDARMAKWFTRRGTRSFKGRSTETRSARRWQSANPDT